MVTGLGLGLELGLFILTHTLLISRYYSQVSHRGELVVEYVHPLSET